MKGLRFLLLSLVIFLASGVKAQFYDGPDDIYYYVLEKQECISDYNGKITNFKIDENTANVYIFNFDGLKATELTGGFTGISVTAVKRELTQNPSYYEEKVEYSDYNWKYVKSSNGVIYENPNPNLKSYIYSFSSNRYSLTVVFHNISGKQTQTYKRVDKSFFKVGRSRTPTSTMHE